MFVEYVFSAILKMQVVKAVSVWGDFLETHTPQSTKHKAQGAGCKAKSKRQKAKSTKHKIKAVILHKT